jgi:hypothetical protein
MKSHTNLTCEFVKGSDDYVNTDVSPIEISSLKDGGTLVVTRVALPSGEWIRSGEAFKTPNGIELVYHTFNNGEIAFELYGCELQFYLEETPFNPETKFTLKKCSHDEPAQPLEI